MGCVSSSNKFYICGGHRNSHSSTTANPARPTDSQVSAAQNNISISSLDTGTNSNANNIVNLHQIQSNTELGSLSNLTAMINNSISFNSNNSNSVLIANTLTNTTANYYNNNTSASFVPPTGKNKKLKKDFLKYFKFDKSITEKQLNAKREEFWDTAPAFEGKIEIWSALKAAVEAYEQKNFQLAQAIIDSANIILPKGFLNDCYDELGNRYQLPIYVLAKPINMRKSNASNEDKDSTYVDDDSQSSKANKKSPKKMSKKKSKDQDIDADEEEDDDDEDELNELNLGDLNIQKNKSSFFKNKLKLSRVKNASNLIGSTSFSFDTKSKSKTPKEEGATSTLQRASSIEDLFQIKLRVSNLNYNDQDLKVKVTSNQTVRQLKAAVKEMVNIEPIQQRMFFGGKLMKDRQKLGMYKLRRNVVVQVIVRETKPVDDSPTEEITKLDSIIIQEDEANKTAV